MAYFLFAVEKVWDDGHTMRIGEGIRMSYLSKNPHIKDFIQGIVLELRLPDGSKKRTFLLNYAVSGFRREDDSVQIDEDPFIRFTLPQGWRSNDVPIGTEVWWINEEVGKGPAEMERLMAQS